MGKSILLASLFAVATVVWPGTPRAEEFVFAYLGIADDPYYMAERRYTGMVLKQPHPPPPCPLHHRASHTGSPG